MTAGNKTFDTRVPPYSVGFYKTRVWNGGDYPATKPKVMSAKVTTVDRYGRPKKSYLRTYFVKAPKRSYIVPHPYSLDIIDQYNPLITSGPYAGRSPTYLWGSATYGRFSTDNWTANDDLALLSQLRERCAGSSFNAGVFLGEGHQTLRLIGDTAHKLYRAFTKVKKGDFRSASRILTGKAHDPATGRVANNWLELQYGWLPLLSDVHDGALFLAHHLNTPLVVTVRARRVLKRDSINQSPSSSYPDRSTSMSKGQIIARLSEKDVAQLAGLTNPASVAWELVPFSFVADWFIPIGQYLDARGLQSALTGTFITTRYFECEANGYTRANKAPLYRYRKVTLRRTVSTTIQVPFPEFKPLSKVASWQHAANGLALITQLFK